MADAQLLQAIEISQKGLPFQHDAGLAGEVFQVFLHGQGQERTKDVTANGGVGRMKDRSRAHHRLGSQEQVLDHEQIAVTQDACSGVILALVRNTRMPSKRASSASLPASISNTGLSLVSRVLRR